MAYSKATSSVVLTRRRLLSAVSAMSVLSLSQLPLRAFADGFDIDAFLELSEELVGQDDLRKDIASEMLAAFGETGQMDDMASLAQGADDDGLANSIVASWYTGYSPNQDDENVLTYTDALIWQAMDYTKPMAYCGDGMGYWADPPRV